MHEELRGRIEIETIHEKLEDLDYYRLLLIDPDASSQDIDQAFRNQTRALHPDRFFGDEQAHQKAQVVFRRINEAWRTLKDPAMRKVYDRDHAKKGTVRMTTERREAAERRKNRDIRDAAKTPQGKKYWVMALNDRETKNYKGALLNAEMALGVEPNNRTIARWTEKLRAKVEKRKARTPAS